MSKTDLGARPIYHHKRDSIEAHLTIVMAALAVSHWLERQTRTPLLCQNLGAVLPEPVPPLIKNASFASIMRVRSWAAPEVSEPEATQSWSEKFRCAGTRREMQVPGDAKQPSTACARLPSGSLASTKGTASSKPQN